jgi:peptide-methionine (S)-S-oxide reductase
MKKFLIAGILALSTAIATTAASAQQLATAIFAGGCFWCVESDFDHVPGVVKTISGFTGGRTKNPTYKQVTYGDTGHREAVEITYDPSKVSYETLLNVFWHSVDPTDGGGQFCDRGVSYRSAIFVRSHAERRLAEATKQQVMKELDQKVATTVEAASDFYPAEDYHQDYYTKNPLRYKFYRWNCNRNQRVEEVWGDKAYMGIPKTG